MLYTCIYLHFLSDLMNDRQLLNNWFVNDAIFHLEIINWSLTKYDNTIIKQIMDVLINQEKSIYCCIYKLLIMCINVL